MTILILSPCALRAMNDVESEVPLPELDVKDDRSDYSICDGDGLWIAPFLEFLEEKVASRAHIRDFKFSQAERLDQQLLEEIPSPYVRALISEFINAEYENWRDRDVDLPNYDRICERSRGYCDGCESGWNEIHGEYDGPLAEDVDPDEDENEAGISTDERQDRHSRNVERRRERARRTAAQEETESEVVEREFVCDSDCDGLLDEIDTNYRDAFDPNLQSLRQRWEDFLVEKGEKNFPPLHG